MASRSLPVGVSSKGVVNQRNGTLFKPKTLA
jgi:hypothetical protein